MKIKQKRRSIYLLPLIFLITLIHTGCSVNLISGYDQQTDQNITKLQRNLETFFVTLESQINTDKSKYENYLEFYNQTKVEISAIQLRVNALPNNKNTSDQIKLLKINLNTLEELHKTGISSKELINQPRKDFNTALSSILKLELAKKYGDE